MLKLALPFEQLNQLLGFTNQLIESYCAALCCCLGH